MDGLDPQQVAVGQPPASLARLKTVVVAPADDQVTRRCPCPVGQDDVAAVVDQSEVDQVVPDAA